MSNFNSLNPNSVVLTAKVAPNVHVANNVLSSNIAAFKTTCINVKSNKENEYKDAGFLLYKPSVIRLDIKRKYKKVSFNSNKEENALISLAKAHYNSKPSGFEYLSNSTKRVPQKQ